MDKEFERAYADAYPDRLPDYVAGRWSHVCADGNMQWCRHGEHCGICLKREDDGLGHHGPKDRDRFGPGSVPRRPTGAHTMNTEAINQLVARWSQPGGIPFKGSLISDDGCMCAQGQALHYVGGWDAERLRSVGQDDADRETAKLLGISTAHAVLLRRVNDGQPGAPSVVLTDPAQVLGDQAHIVLAFWRHLDRMTPAQWKAVAGAVGSAGWASAWVAAGDAVKEAAGYAAWAATWDACGGVVGATNEIQGAALMRAKGQAFYFLPLFGFADPEAVLAADLQETTP